MKVIAMIPARMGSQRLAKKNLCELNGVPLITRAIRKCMAANVFDEVWVNSEDDEFGAIAAAEGAYFHKRPEQLADNNATSEQFVAEFLEHNECDMVIQVHSIAPLLTAAEVQDFVLHFKNSDYDVMLSCIHDQIECAHQNTPINFTFAEKTNSQDLAPVQRVTWSVTGWRSAPYMATTKAGKCATYSGKTGFYPVGALSGHVIKTQHDLDVATALLPLIEAEEAELRQSA